MLLKLFRNNRRVTKLIKRSSFVNCIKNEIAGRSDNACKSYFLKVGKSIFPKTIKIRLNSHELKLDQGYKRKNHRGELFEIGYLFKIILMGRSPKIMPSVKRK